MEHITVTRLETGFSGRNRRNKKRARHCISYGICAAAIGVFVCTSSSAWAGKWSLEPHLEVLETYTDNVNLTPTNEKTDFVTRVSPGAHLQGQGARISADIDYTLNYLYFARSDDQSDVRHDLSAQANSELVSDLFFLDARASINQQFVDRGGSLSQNYDNRTNNRRTVQNYLVSPYLRHAFGTWMEASLRYRLSYQRSDADRTVNIVPGGVFSNSLSHEVGFNLDSGRRFTRLQWGANLSRQIRDRSFGDNKFKRTTARFHSRYVVKHWISLLGSIGYEKFDDATLTNRRNGLIWDAGVRLDPGPRTSLSVKAGRRYGRFNVSVDGHYIFSPKTRLSFGYHEEVTTSQDILAGELANSGQISDVIQDPGGFSLTNSAFRRKRAQASINGNRGRTSYSLSSYYETRLFEALNEKEKNYGGNGNLSRQIGPHLSGYIGAGYRHSEFRSQNNRKDDYYHGNVGLNYQILQSLSGGITYIYTYRKSTLALFDVRENAVRINLKATF